VSHQLGWDAHFAANLLQVGERHALTRGELSPHALLCLGCPLEDRGDLVLAVPSLGHIGCKMAETVAATQIG
jgi:hypothetical protein